MYFSYFVPADITLWENSPEDLCIQGHRHKNTSFAHSASKVSVNSAHVNTSASKASLTLDRRNGATLRRDAFKIKG